MQSEKSPGQRARRRDATRGLVLAAALELFSRRGFDGTALVDVAERTGIAVPLIVYHFKSKDGLWRACVDEVYARIEAQLEKPSGEVEPDTGVAFYREAIRAFITALAVHPEYMRIVILEGMEASPRLDWLVATHQRCFTERLVALIQAAQRDGLMPPVDPTYAKFVLSGAFALPIVLAAEYRMIDGTDALSKGFLERHIDDCCRLVLPRLSA